ncbi:MAG: hypothetical protein LC674_01055, partial [Actinobacteria bacterium]|nr:hypothetical protein [Actinomycetota bacterium]
GEEGLAGSEAALWLQAQSLTLEYAGKTLSRYEVKYAPGSDRLREVGRPTLFESAHRLAQLRLFELNILGEGGWLKALKLEEYAPRQPRRAPASLQQVLFAYTEAI